MKFCSAFLVICLFLACTGDASESTADDQGQEQVETPEPITIVDFQRQVRGLTTDRDKIAFLKEIITSDQEVRETESEVLQAHGYESEQHNRAVANVMEVDKRNRDKIVAYTNAYDSLAVNSVGMMHAEALWLVVHHSSGISMRKQYYPLLRAAWESELLGDTRYTLFLNRWLEKKTGQRNVMEGAYTPEEEVRVLHKKLGLPR